MAIAFFRITLHANASNRCSFQQSQRSRSMLNRNWNRNTHVDSILLHYCCPCSSQHWAVWLHWAQSGNRVRQIACHLWWASIKECSVTPKHGKNGKEQRTESNKMCGCEINPNDCNLQSYLGFFFFCKVVALHAHCECETTCRWLD